MSPKKSGFEHYTNKGLQSRQRIIDTAMSMIRTRGYGETTVQGICAGVGIGVGTFYHYFHSKEEVLLAFIDMENKDLLDFYFRQEKTSYGRALLATADYYVDMYFFKGANLIAHVYSMLLLSSIDLGNLSEFAFHQILEDAFIHGQRSGEFSRDISVEFFCNMAMGEWYFFTSLWCYNPDTFKIREMVAGHFTRLMKLVAAPKCDACEELPAAAG